LLLLIVLWTIIIVVIIIIVIIIIVIIIIMNAFQIMVFQKKTKTKTKHCPSSIYKAFESKLNLFLTL